MSRAAERKALVMNPPAAPAASRRRLQVLSVIREALAGGERDFTTGPIGQAVVLLAIPMVMEMTMESVFALCDVLFVSRLGVDAVATVGLTEAVMTILYSVAGGLAIATTAMVSRRIGEQRSSDAASVTVQAIVLAVAVSATAGGAGALLAPRILGLMGGSSTLVSTGSGYAAVVIGAAPTVMLLFVINAAFRGAGDPALAMRALWLANGINLVLDPCLIFGLGPFPELGLTGAAIATAIGRGSGVLYQLAMLSRSRSRLRPGPGVLRLRLPVMLDLARLSFGGVMQSLVAHSSWVAVVRIIGSFGSAAVAGYTIAIRIIIFALLPSWGLSNSAATMMGQSLGAGKPERAERAVWMAGLYNVIFLVAVAVVFIAGAEPLIGLFTRDPQVLANGVDCLRIIAYGYGFYALGMVMVQAINGAGDTTTPTLINVLCYWLLQIPLAWVLATRTGLGARGVFLAILIAEAMLTVIGVMVFRSGSWRTRKV